MSRAPPGSRSTDLEVTRSRVAALVASRSLELPMMPGVAAEVMASSLDEHADAARLAQLIQQDQGLVGHVLRVVNSPAFRGATEIVALRQAIARLGMDRIREIALTASLSESLFRQTHYQPLADRAWKLALCAGLWAKEVARTCRKNTEMAYLCGLLHNIGSPLILGALTRLVDAPLPPAAVEPLLAEFAAPAGALLARDWKLPDVVVATVQHLDDFAAAAEHADGVAIANAAVTIAALMLGNGVLVPAVSAIESVRHLNLYPEDVETLLDARADVRIALESMVT